MTCHCGSCEDHRPSSYGMGAFGYYMENEEARNEAYERVKEFMVTGRNPRNDRDQGPSPSSEELAWENAEKWQKKAEDFLNNSKEERRQHLNIVLTTNEENDRFVVKILTEGARVLYKQETGIEPMYLAHAAEDYLIPLRNLLEGLGYEVQETYE